MRGMREAQKISRVVPDKHFVSTKGTVTALNNASTSAQNIFPSGNDELTLKAGTTYGFRAKIGLNTGATSHTTAFGLGGTATFSGIGYTALATSAASAAAIATPQMASPRTAAAAGSQSMERCSGEMVPQAGPWRPPAPWPLGHADWTSVTRSIGLRGDRASHRAKGAARLRILMWPYIIYGG
jgi:hypothetical protein